MTTHIHTHVEPEDAICDFCSDTDPTWEFQCEGTGREYGESMPGVHHMDADGRWAACDECKVMIMERSNAMLVKHSCESFYQKNPDMPEEFRPQVLAGIRQVHNFFFTNWRGNEPRRVG